MSAWVSGAWASGAWAGTVWYSSAAVVRTVTLRLVNKAESGAAMPSLTGLRWAFYDTTDPSAWAAGPVDKGSSESTDGSGDLVVSLPNTTLTAGQVGWLIVTDSDGTVTQSPPCRSFCGPVTVA